jgi:hypothetical protein
MPPVSTPRPSSPRSAGPRSNPRPNTAHADKPEHEILFQTYFKSVGPRTYAAQVKKASNDNHYLVLTEGKRDEKTGELRKARLFVYGEDFVAFFKMLQETSLFIRANPVSDEVKQRRAKFWARKGRECHTASDRRPPPPKPTAGSQVAPPAPAVGRSPKASPRAVAHRNS